MTYFRTLILGLLPLIALQTRAIFADDAIESDAATSKTVEWSDDLTAAAKAAQASGKPLLIRVGAAWCGWCEKLTEEIADPSVQKELGRWTLIYLDSDVSPAEVRQLGIGPIPALRILSPSGKAVAGHDGFLEHEQLLSWLKEQFGKATQTPSDAILETGPPSKKDLVLLLAAFESQNTVERETAIRRLIPYPAESAKAVTAAFAKDRLAVRLAALELFSEWKAPVENLDPWRPETITNEGLAALSAWADQQATAASTDNPQARELTPEEFASAETEIARLPALTESDAHAAIERLAKFRTALLPLVYKSLKSASSDRATQYLNQLRYRVSASDALVLQWPGGIERLASADSATRHQAATELAEKASTGDEPLLLELFSDPDALVREISLRSLRNVSKGEPPLALVRLLDDPEPNVRAAVLKQLAEDPDAELIPSVSKYVLEEKDPDLVVHAIRVLKEVKTPSTRTTLMKLLSHESWQVRAEAAEALSGAVDASDPATSADIYVALIERLTDPDSFVVSRAIKGLEDAELVAKLEPMAKAAQLHPDLAGDVVEAMVGNNALQAKAIPYLREFYQNKNPAVRARAIRGLVEANDDDLDKKLIASLADDSMEVRIAAIESIQKTFDEALSEVHNDARQVSYTSGGGSFFESFKKIFSSDDKPKKEKSEESEAGDVWLREYQAGTGRPSWTNELVPPLQKSLTSDDKRERLLAAIALPALGKQTEALPVLEASVENDPKLCGDAAAALPWLLWPERKTFFDRLTRLGSEGDRSQIIRHMGQSVDLRSAEPLWMLAESEDISSDLIGQIYHALSSLYELEQRTNQQGEQHTAPAVIARWKKIATEGHLLKRVLALALMVNHQAQDDAEELARKIMDDSQIASQFRVDAFQIVLVALKANEADKLASKQLASDNLEIRKLALSYLARGTESIHMLRSGIWMQSAANEMYLFNESSPISIDPPTGITEEQVRPLLKDTNPEIGACAGYLLATLGNADGLDQLISVWRNADNADPWKRPVYRAIAALNDDSRTPILAEINEKLDGWQKREFYWTIRGMDGPEVKKLRKQIRDTVGMSNLKN
jgi:HEAT repeat protein/thioredoxin-like negative regulator of GroEL